MPVHGTRCSIVHGQWRDSWRADLHSERRWHGHLLGIVHRVPGLHLVAAQRRNAPTLSSEVGLPKVPANGGRREVLDVGVDAHVGLDFDEGND